MKSQRNIKLVVAYNGANYHGWQRQVRHLDTVQQQIEDVAARIIGERVILHGAGRTDAGVHAAGQVANFYTNNLTIPPKGLRRALNSRLPKDIGINSADDVPERFHAARSAIGKTYRYRIYTAPRRPVELTGQVYHFWRELDIDRMQAGARRLIGTHDFRGLATSAEVRQNTVRTIYRCEVARNDFETIVTVEGDGFLYNMVRNIVGTLMNIGRGLDEVDNIDRIIETHLREHCGPCVPPDGLSMMCVHYRPEDLVV